jgi:phosphoribosylformylglycinamidine synthase
MTPYEVMLSESQERMLVIVKPQHEEDVRKLFEHWELHVETIGVVTDDGLVRIRDGDREVVRVPATQLTEAPTYVRDGVKPAWLDELQAYDLSQLPDVGAGAQNGAERTPRTSDVLLELLASPEIASKRMVWRQYDHQVGTNTVIGPGSDAAVLRIKDTNKAIAVATDGNAAYTYLDPYAGGAIAVAEAARNVACTGARPLAMTNCLNFGNPEKPEVYYQLSEAIRGMSDAARALDLPVISGNVSLYNETNGEAIWPTPVVGVVGLIEDVERVVPMGFRGEGDSVLVAGAAPAIEGFAGSAYLKATRDVVAGRPPFDIDAETRLQRFVIEAAEAGLLRSAHDVSAGGLAVSIAESCIDGGVGLQSTGRFDAVALFSESQSRVALSCAPADRGALEAIAARHGVPLTDIGVTGGDRLVLGEIDLPVSALRDAYESGLPAALAGVTANA